jgi:putative glutamine amidotransferase
MNSTTNGAALGASGRPVIGISAHSGPAKFAIWDTQVTLSSQALIDRLTAAGCLPVLLPPLPGIEQALRRLDGLVLPSGLDVDPAQYGAEPHPATRTSPSQDAAELALLGAALRAGLPVLGICRGLHVFNVFRNGTLHQHLPEVTGHSGHMPRPGVFGPQEVRLEQGSRVAKIFGREAVRVPCHHHQAVDRLGPGLAATAWSEDGLVEAVELADHPFAIAVQWHAEESEDDSLFLALAEASKDSSADRR